MTKYKILLVDDEEDILEFLSYNLKKEKFEVYTSNSGIDAINKAKKILPNLILLDVMMPGMDGIEACNELRKNKNLNNTVIAFLTARGEDYTQIAGFDAGADDFINKPIKPKVLISRINALLKRVEPNKFSDVEDFQAFKVDRERYIITIGNKEILLPRKEFELVELLHTKPGRVFTRDEIYNSIWGENVIVSDRTIDVHVRKIREKIGKQYIETIKGVGYKFVQ